MTTIFSIRNNVFGMNSRQCKLYSSKVEMGGKQHSWTYFPHAAIRLARSKRPMNEKHEGLGRHTRIYCPATGNPSSGDWGRESDKKRSEWECLCHEKCFKCWNKTNETYLVYLSSLQVSLPELLADLWLRAYFIVVVLRVIWVNRKERRFFWPKESSREGEWNFEWGHKKIKSLSYTSGSEHSLKVTLFRCETAPKRSKRYRTQLLDVKASFFHNLPMHAARQDV